MSYVMSAALQEAVFNALSLDVTLDALVGSYITLGGDEAKDRSSARHKGVTLDFEVNITRILPALAAPRPLPPKWKRHWRGPIWA